VAPVAAVLVPVKAFHRAKVRLAPALPADERAALARTMAEGVLRAADGLPVAVVCDDQDVAVWARSRGAEVVWAPGRGLNGAVAAGVDQLAAAGIHHVIVAHGDLPLADHLGWVADFEGVTIVPDRHDKGTNVLGVPAAAGFRFSYGAGSFERHRIEAHRLGLPLRVSRSPRLTWDVDVPADLDFSRSAPCT
jgi:2-phospho-L-lactate guanylyltransferase